MAVATATALTYAALAITAIGTGVSIYGQQQAKESQEKAAAYNSQLAASEARNKEAETAEAIARQRRKDKSQRAALLAKLSTGGTLTTSGTPLLIMQENAGNQELAIADALRASSIQAASIRAQGQMGLWESSQASKAADLSSIGTGLSGLGSITGSYSKSLKSGAI